MYSWLSALYPSACMVVFGVAQCYWSFNFFMCVLPFLLSAPGRFKVAFQGSCGRSIEGNWVFQAFPESARLVCKLILFAKISQFDCIVCLRRPRSVCCWGMSELLHLWIVSRIFSELFWRKRVVMKRQYVAHTVRFLMSVMDCLTWGWNVCLTCCRQKLSTILNYLWSQIPSSL